MVKKMSNFSNFAQKKSRAEDLNPKFKSDKINHKNLKNIMAVSEKILENSNTTEIVEEKKVKPIRFEKFLLFHFQSKKDFKFIENACNIVLPTKFADEQYGFKITNLKREFIGFVLLREDGEILDFHLLNDENNFIKEVIKKEIKNKKTF